jgi:hypothetical protein
MVGDWLRCIPKEMLRQNVLRADGEPRVTFSDGSGPATQMMGRMYLFPYSYIEEMKV